jgi:hypothetical protein
MSAVFFILSISFFCLSLPFSVFVWQLVMKTYASECFVFSVGYKKEKRKEKRKKLAPKDVINFRCCFPRKLLHKVFYEVCILSQITASIKL